jgi:hypothetical protein
VIAVNGAQFKSHEKLAAQHNEGVAARAFLAEMTA